MPGAPGLAFETGDRRACVAPSRPGPTPSLLRAIIRIYTVRYEWDERKNRQNQRKHGGISFELAALVFQDEHCLFAKDKQRQSG